MGAFFKPLGQGKNREEKNKIPVRLVPSQGKILEFEVTEQNGQVAKMYMKNLITYAENLGRLYGTTNTIRGNKISIVFDDEEIASQIRADWKPSF